MKFKKGKILILGARGNLGQQLAEVFADKEPIIWDRSEIDITDKELVVKKIKELKPALIINAAAYNAVDKCEESAEEYALAQKLNGQAVGFIAAAALEIKAILIHYSSDYVFNGEDKNGYQEEDRPEPVNNYGRSKLQGEEAIISLSGRGLKWYLIRTSKLFGPRGASEFSKPSFFDIMLKLAREKEELDVVDEEVSCFTYTPDLAAATRKLAEEGVGFGIYHLANSGPATWYEAAKELFRQAGIKIKVNPVPGSKFPRPARRPRFSVLLNTKADKLRPWTEALGDFLSPKSSRSLKSKV